MSSTFTFSPPCVPAMPSVIMFKQNGQAVARVRAPVAMASSARKCETRCSGASSNHNVVTTNGALTIDPDGPGPLFEVPIAGALPEDLGFIP